MPVSNSWKSGLLWLLLRLAAGSGIAFAGFLTTGSAAWLLALPLALVGSWWHFADGAQRLPPANTNKPS